MEVNLMTVGKLRYILTSICLNLFSSLSFIQKNIHEEQTNETIFSTQTSFSSVILRDEFCYDFIKINCDVSFNMETEQRECYCMERKRKRTQ